MSFFRQPLICYKSSSRGGALRNPITTVLLLDCYSSLCRLYLGKHIVKISWLQLPSSIWKTLSCCSILVFCFIQSCLLFFDISSALDVCLIYKIWYSVHKLASEKGFKKGKQYWLLQSHFRPVSTSETQMRIHKDNKFAYICVQSYPCKIKTTWEWMQVNSNHTDS